MTAWSEYPDGGVRMTPGICRARLPLCGSLYVWLSPPCFYAEVPNSGVAVWAAEEGGGVVVAGEGGTVGGGL
jgi:hypothetical protein